MKIIIFSLEKMQDAVKYLIHNINKRMRGIFMGSERELLELYLRDYRITSVCYKMMGKMLDKKWVKKRLELHNMNSLYIYGGGYLGIQLYNAIGNMSDVKAVVDKSGLLSVDIPDIRVLSLDNLMKEYSGEKIIITPVKYYQKIWNDLIKFVKEEDLLFLGEFLEGMVQ